MTKRRSSRYCADIHIHCAILRDTYTHIYVSAVPAIRDTYTHICVSSACYMCVGSRHCACIYVLLLPAARALVYEAIAGTYVSAVPAGTAIAGTYVSAVPVL